jgi:hypothetical protein
MLFLNLRKGIENKLAQIKHQYYSLNIVIEKPQHEEYDYYPTTVRDVSDRTLINEVIAADEELFDVVEFKL